MMIAQMDRYSNKLPAYDRDHDRSSANSMRPDTDYPRLPPLNEAVPEIHQTNPSIGRHGRPTRSYYDPSNSTTQFPEAKSLAPSPLMSVKSRSSTASRLATQGQSPPSGIPDDRYGSSATSSTSSSVYSERRRGSYASTVSSAGHSTVMKPNPVTSPHPAIATTYRSHGQAQDLYNLPSISSFAADDRADPYRRDSLMLSTSNEPRKPYSAYQHYGNVSNPEYYYPDGPYQERPPFPGPSIGGSYQTSFDNASDYSDSKNKRRRGNLPKAVTDILRAWFMNHVAHPYPTEAEKQELIARTGLTISQISNWFINARRRNLPVMTKSAQTESDHLNLQNERHRMGSDDEILPAINR